MDALHGPVAHSGSAQRTAVTAAIFQNAPCIAKMVAVLQERVENIFIVVGVLLVEAIRNKADPVAAVGRLRDAHWLDLSETGAALDWVLSCSFYFTGMMSDEGGH